jgi:hypothetical protein
VYLGRISEKYRAGQVVVISLLSNPAVGRRPARVAAHRFPRRLAELMRLKSISPSREHTARRLLCFHDGWRCWMVKLQPGMIVNGGIIHAYGSTRAWVMAVDVVEADESGGTFNRFHSNRNCYKHRSRHMEHWGWGKSYHAGFYDFVSNIRSQRHCRVY